MAGLPQCSGAEAVKAFERLGYVQVKKQGKGSHVFMKCEGRNSLSVPQKNPVPKGTLRSLIRDARITVEEFTELLKA